MTGIGTPFLLGTASGAANAAMTITPNFPVPAGAAVIVCTGSNGGGTALPAPATVTDTSGNGYADVQKQKDNAPYASMWGTFNCAALTTSSTITITFSGSSSQNVWAIAMAVTGLATTSTFDQGAHAHGESKNLAVTTGQLGLLGELVVVFWTVEHAAGMPPVVPSNWSALAAFTTGSSPPDFATLAYLISPSTSPITAKATVPSTDEWGAVIGTFRWPIIPAAQLAMGGTMTPFPVQADKGTATLGCGGSILGPLELAPYAPPPQPVFPAGYGAVSADFGGWVRQSFGYAAQGTVFRAEQHTVQSLTGGASNVIAFDTMLEDPWAGWSAAATSQQAANSWLVPWTGLYRVTFTCNTVSNAAAIRYDAQVGVSGVNPMIEFGSSTTPANFAGGGNGGSCLLPLVKGDYVQFLCFASATVNTDVSAGFYPSVEVTAVQTDLQI